MDAKKFFIDIYGEEIYSTFNFRSDGDASYLIIKLITNLDSKSEKIIRMLYGLDNGYPRTIKDISKELLLPEASVEQLVEKSVAKLKDQSIIGPYYEKAKKLNGMNALKNKEIESLNLPVSILKNLKEHNISFVKDLIQYSYLDLLNLGGFSRKDIAKIYCKLMESFELEALIDKEAYNKLILKITEAK